MNGTEYLVSHGSAGAIGRFRCEPPIACRRGDSVVIRTERGLELGVVLCPATTRHEHLLKDAPAGALLRHPTAEDEQIAAVLRERQQLLFDDARRLAAELQLPLEVLDVEATLDGHQVTLYYLRWAECDERPLVSALSRKHEALVAMRNLALPEGASGCGRPDCGHDKGGCSSCSSGGCGTCGKTIGKDVQEYFAGLRRQMESSRRVSLA
jgi:cell fate regulator YaaT (PSP1 superfamily)